MGRFIPLAVPVIQGNEWEYVKNCLDTEWVSSAGSYIDKFEQEIADYTGAAYAVACVNGTAALHIALKLAGIEPEDEVLVPTVTFIAPVNTVKYVGAEPIFIDCDDYYNIDAEKTIDFINLETVFKNGASYNKKTSRKISAIILVHVFGNAVYLDDLVEICQERNIRIIEDAAESLGTRYIRGKYDGEHTGTIGDIGCLSFNGNKIITAGGGGMILTNNKELSKKACYLTTQGKDDELRYVHDEVGYNYRLTNIQAALGLAQLEQLSEFLKIKRQNHILYKKEINKIPGLKICDGPNYSDNNYWMCGLQINPKQYGTDRDQLIQYLLQHKIQTKPIWHLNHLQVPYKNCQTYHIEKAPGMLEISLKMPSSVNLSSDGIRRVVKTLKVKCKQKYSQKKSPALVKP